MSGNLSDFLDTESEAAFDSAVANTRPDPIPAGDYMLEMDSFEFKPTANGDGMMMNGVFKVMEGEYEGRTIYNRFNVRNKNSIAQNIGMGQVTAMCNAMGITKEDFKHESSLAIGRPFNARVKVTPERIGKDGKTYSPSNEIQGFKPADDAAPPTLAGKAAPIAAAVAAPTVKPAPIGGARKMVWEKKAPADATAPF